jgi:hypothetical protein
MFLMMLISASVLHGSHYGTAAHQSNPKFITTPLWYVLEREFTAVDSDVLMSSGTDKSSIQPQFLFSV